MSTYRRLLFGLITCLLISASTLTAQEVKDGLTWYTDVKKAHEISAKTSKPIFAFFTGSDWCGWCHRLQDRVFSKSEFKKWAKQNVILLELDFPRKKQLPDELAKQNSDLQQAFAVRGYPTIWIFNLTKNKETDNFMIAALGSLGYPRAEAGKEASAFLEQANTILKSKK